MDVASANTGAPDAAVEYANRLGSLNASQLADRKRDRLFGMAKLAIASSALVAAALSIYNILVLAPLLVLVSAFVAMLIAHERLLGRIAPRTRTIQFYERGLARLNGKWASGGATGERYLDPSHVYARDLDLF